MNLLRKITSSNFFNLELFSFILFIIVHIVLFNFNSAEWGDSYRILRASEFIRDGSYPSDEKRPPLFSAVLALRPFSLDAVIWGRMVLFIFSTLSFLLFYKLVKTYVKKEKYRFFALILFIFNPVYLYWSIRIMADVPFSFFVLLFFYIVAKWDDLNFFKISLLGFVCGLSILTRFEGYLLLGSGIILLLFQKEDLFKDKIKIKNILSVFFRNFKKVIPLLLTTLLVISPWLLYRNPLKSKYFDEAEKRVYDLKMVWTYLTSLIYVLGFTSAMSFIIIKFRIVKDFLLKNIGIFSFILFELVLILLWPAAIPRLFVPLIPFFILILVMSVESYISDNGLNLTPPRIIFIISILLTFFYLISQYYLKLQFLVLGYKMLAVIFLVQIISLIFLFTRKNTAYLIVIVLSTVLWSFYAINMHRHIFKTITEASKYASDNLTGKIAYNDISAIPDWYLNVSNSKSENSGIHMLFEDNVNLKFNKLKDEEVDYLILSNEHNPNVSVNLEKRKYLQLIQEFSYNVNGTVFFAKIIRFNQDYIE